MESNSNIANTEVLKTDEKISLAIALLTAMQQKDWTKMRSLLTEDCYWEMPGENLLSGRSSGIDATILKAQTITSYGLNIQLNHILCGLHDFAVSLHNKAERDGIILDEYLVSQCKLRGRKICAITTYLSDIPMMDAFFLPVT